MNGINDCTLSSLPIDCRHLRRYLSEYYLLIWLANEIDETNEECKNTLKTVRNLVDTIYIFFDPDECVDFFSEINDTKICLIVNGTTGEHIVPLIHDIPQLGIIHIITHTSFLSHEWTDMWTKIKSIHTDILSSCSAWKLPIRLNGQNSVATTVISLDEINRSKNLNELDPTFMYSQILKDILLEMKDEDKSLGEFLAFCRDKNHGSAKSLDLFEQEYHNRSPIWWYSRPDFLYLMLNYALRTLETDIMIKIGFFIRVLHQQIQKLYDEQRDNYGKKCITVHRGQGLSKEDFEKITQAKDGLISFNNFLSTSESREVSFGFAFGASTDPEKVGILFVISIDLSISSTPFARIQKHSSQGNEEEILFSMHTIFRIGDVKPIDGYDQLYEIQLRLTTDEDHELRLLTNWLSRDVPDEIGWKRLGNLLIRIGQLNKAEEFYNTLLKQTSDTQDIIHYYGQLASIKLQQDDREMYLWYLLRIRELEKSINPNFNDENTAVIMSFSEDNSGLLFLNNDCALDSTEIIESVVLQTEYSPNEEVSTETLSFYEKALVDFERNLCSKNSHSIPSYNHIDSTADDLKQSCPLLWFQRKILEIRQRFLHPNHIDVARSYGVVASFYSAREDNDQARLFYQKAIDIYEETLPSHHPTLGCLYNNIGMTYQSTGEYSQALRFVEKSCDIAEKALPPNHPDRGFVYGNLAGIYAKLDDYSKAVLFYKKQLAINENNSPVNDKEHVCCCTELARIYCQIEQYSEALPFYEKALAIRQKLLVAEDPQLLDDYVAVGLVYGKLGNYSNALLFYTKALDIAEKHLSPDHEELSTYYDAIARLHEHNEDYQQAILFYEKTLAINQKASTANHMNLMVSYNNLGIAYVRIAEYSKALFYLEHALNIMETCHSKDDFRCQKIQETIDYLKQLNEVAYPTFSVEFDQ